MLFFVKASEVYIAFSVVEHQLAIYSGIELRELLFSEQSFRIVFNIHVAAEIQSMNVILFVITFSNLVEENKNYNVL